MLRHRYVAMLVLVVVHLVAMTLDLPFPWTDLANLFAAPAFAWVLQAVTGRRRDFWVMLVLGCAASVLNLVVPWVTAPLWLNLVKVALWCAAPAYLALRLFTTVYRSESVTYGEISAALAVYLLIAHVFADFFEALYTFDTAALRFGDTFPPGPVAFGDVLYFSLITLSTLGYGDVAPASPAARVVAVVESVTGLMYIAILVARLVSLQAGDHPSRRP